MLIKTKEVIAKYMITKLSTQKEVHNNLLGNKTRPSGINKEYIIDKNRKLF